MVPVATKIHQQAAAKVCNSIDFTFGFGIITYLPSWLRDKMTTHAHGPVAHGPKANQHFLQFNRWETTNKLDFSEPSTRPPRRLLPLEPVVQVKVQKRDTKVHV